MGVLGGIGRGLTAGANAMRESQELALRRALQEQQVQMQQRQLDLQQQQQTRLMNADARDAAEMARQDKMRGVDFMMKMDPVGTLNNPDALATLKELNISLPTDSAYEQFKQSNSPLSNEALEDVARGSGVAPMTGVKIPPAMQMQNAVTESAMSQLPKLMDSPLGLPFAYRTLTGGNPPSQLFAQPPQPRALKTWKLSDGSILNLPNNELPPDGAVPYQAPFFTAVAAGGGVGMLNRAGGAFQYIPDPNNPGYALPAPPPAGMEQRAADADIAKGTLGNISKLDPAKIAQWVGPLQGRLTEMKLWSGKNVEDGMPELQVYLENLRASRQAAMTGLAAPVAEMDRILSGLPTMYTPYEAWDGKIKAVDDQIRLAIERYGRKATTAPLSGGAAPKPKGKIFGAEREK